MDVVDVESVLIGLDDVPLARLRDPGDDPVLVHALRRVVDAAARNPADTVAAFNNWV
jgi:FXSXX-COOH protein